MFYRDNRPKRQKADSHDGDCVYSPSPDWPTAAATLEWTVVEFHRALGGLLCVESRMRDHLEDWTRWSPNRLHSESSILPISENGGIRDGSELPKQVDDHVLSKYREYFRSCLAQEHSVQAQGGRSRLLHFLYSYLSVHDTISSQRRITNCCC